MHSRTDDGCALASIVRRRLSLQEPRRHRSQHEPDTDSSTETLHVSVRRSIPAVPANTGMKRHVKRRAEKGRNMPPQWPTYTLAVVNGRETLTELRTGTLENRLVALLVE